VCCRGKFSANLKRLKSSCTVSQPSFSAHGNYLLQECQKPPEVYGFEQSSKKYSLASFGQMADQFKENYFQKPVHVSHKPLCEAI